VGIQPQPFTIYPDKIEDCANSSFKFFYNGTAPEPTTFKWKFSSSDSSFEKNPSRIFKELGPKDVTLTVFDNGCPLSVTEIGMINVKGVVGDFRVNNDCANPLDPQFEDKSLGNIETWQWTFGDGSPDKNYIVAEPPFIHSFANPDKYKIKLTVIGDGCIYTDSTNIIVTNETGIDFNPLAPVCLSDGSTTLKADINNPSFIKKYYWNLGCGERLADDGMFQIMFANTCNGAPYSRGSYPMWIRVVDVNGCEYKSLEKDIYIGGPSAEITALTAVTGCENLTVKFQDNSDVDPNAQIQSRVWDFGDGTSENILSGPISHVFSNLGTSPVRLTVTDEYGCTSTSTMIEVNTSRVDLDFNAGQTISCIARNIQFQTISTSPLVSYQWEFGDGLVSSSPTPRIAYSTSGKKSVRLTVRDGYGCEAIAFKPAYVEIDMPEATFSAVQNTADCPPFDAQFNFEGKYAERFEWVFGDGSKSTTPNPSHLYTTAGKYFVTLKVMSPGGCQVISTPYEIDISGPIGTATFDAFSCEPFDALVKVTSTPDQFVIVDYGDGQVTDRMPYQPQFSHRYADTGFYQPKVFLSNNEGCLVRLPVPNGIKTVDVQPVFKPDNNIFCFNGNVNFSDLSLSNDQFISWDWTMGDGATAAGKNVSHLYTMPGIYDVKLVVKTQLGCVDSVVRVGLIEIKENPEVSIRVSRPIICEDETVEFTATEISSASPIVNWFWDFTNGNSSSLQAPSPESFRKQGVYPVRLYVTDQRGCSDTALVDFIVNALPELEAGPDMQLCLGTPQQLNPSGAQLYQWYAGPTLSCIDCENPLINPTEDAKFYVKGTSVDGCVSYDSIYVEVVGPSTVSAITDTTVCFGDELQLRASGTATYSWSPADGLSATDIANPKARPLQNTTYTVTGSDPYRCFVTTDEVEVRVNPIPQVYAGADTTMMAGYPVQLRPAFSPDVTKVQWEPSTFLNCSDCRTPISNPSYSATYTLFAYNDFGCVSKDVINVFATCTRENLFIPNTFSPNGDGVNEMFFPRGRGIEKIKSLKIFSRWGQMVYSKENFFANDQGAGWNGKRSGVDASTDVYVYMIDLVCENGNIITLKGDIALVR
jgi:gliding motility-associated-like protein